MLMDMDTGEGLDCGQEGWLGGGGKRKKEIGITVIE